MVANILVDLFGSSAAIIIIFIISLYIARYLNSPYILQFMSFICSVGILYVPLLLRSQSSWFVDKQLFAFTMAGFTCLSCLKFLELAFAYKWTYIQQMPFKLVFLYIFALPRMPESESKLSELSKQIDQRESISYIVTGICQLILHRTLLYLIPLEWLSLSSSSFPLIYRYLRYGLLGFLLYLLIASFTNIGFNIYSLIFNVRMKPTYPLFPFLSTSLREFWSYRWNSLVKTSLQLTSFAVVPRLIDPIIPMNKTAKSLLAFALSGLIHEYTLWFTGKKWFGKNMIFFLLHGLLVLFEVTIKLPIKPNTLKEKVFGWLWTFSIMFLTAPLFFEPFVETGVFANMK